MAETTDLVPYAGGTDLAQITTLAEKARDYAEKALAEGTRRIYASRWKLWTDWCTENHIPPIPAAPGALAAFLTWVAEGQPSASGRSARWKGHVLSNSAIATLWSAIDHYHMKMGFPLSKLMKDAAHSQNDSERRQWAALQQIRDGIRRTIGQSRSVRRVAPVSDRDLSDMLELLRPDVLRDARDAAVLAVGFGACRRRSEVVGLDYLERGSGRGSLIIEDKAVIIRLNSSKTNQAGREETYPIYKSHLPILYGWVENWIKVSKPQKGEPLFRSLRGTGYAGNAKRPQSGYAGVHWHEHKSGKGQWVARYRVNGKVRHIDYFDGAREAHLARCTLTGETPHEPFDGIRFLGNRLSGEAVAKIVKERYAAVLRAKYGKRLRADQIAALAEAKAKVSGHSLRRGHITTAAENGIAVHHIKEMSGHATTAMVTDTYISVALNEKTSSQKGMRGL